jgi:hypothetical protein
MDFGLSPEIFFRFGYAVSMETDYVPNAGDTANKAAVFGAVFDADWIALAMQYIRVHAVIPNASSLCILSVYRITGRLARTGANAFPCARIPYV